RCHENSKTAGARDSINLAARKENFMIKRKFWGSPLTLDYWTLAARSLAELAHSYILSQRTSPRDTRKEPRMRGDSQCMILPFARKISPSSTSSGGIVRSTKHCATL